MNEWQPIETAPKDGTWVLVCGNGWDVMMASYSYDGRIGRGYFWGPTEWDDYELAEQQPTHWMPLPEPPENKGF